MGLRLDETRVFFSNRATLRFSKDTFSASVSSSRPENGFKYLEVTAHRGPQVRLRRLQRPATELRGGDDMRAAEGLLESIMPQSRRFYACSATSEECSSAVSVKDESPNEENSYQCNNKLTHEYRHPEYRSTYERDYYGVPGI